MPIADRIARVNRSVTNPIQRLWAGRVPPWAIVEHVGRRSGATYRTPVSAFRADDGSFLVLLLYGNDRDWVKNLTAAGGGVLVRRGREIKLGAPEILPNREGTTRLPAALRPIARARGCDVLVLPTV